VVADDDGVLVLPAAQVQATLDRGQERADKEAAMMAELRKGETTLELMNLTKWRAA
jgi:4-hydroxy-4-methyl-2-oxoglutarate aldolase